MYSYESTGPNDAIDSYLLLEDGSTFEGKHFGADVSVDGEIGKSFDKPAHMLAQVGADACTWTLLPESTSTC